MPHWLKKTLKYTLIVIGVTIMALLILIVLFGLGMMYTPSDSVGPY